MTMEGKLKQAFLDMKRQDAIDLAEKELRSGADSFAILKECRDAMEEVGKRFETGEFFLSELIYSAEVFKAVSALLEPSITSTLPEEDSKVVVVFGTPRGDIHDLGKNIVITMMRAQGFTVHDLGVDVPSERFIEKLQEVGAPILALSALITPALVSMRETISLLVDKGFRKNTFVIIGGGVTTDFARKEVGADAQTLDPAKAIRLCRQYIQDRSRP
ncbi:MAG: cobalamin-dependent protein [Deltaproteobacteria bacterium]|nr:MAG: cobalamin-dependent protein [Deltaproteobacteria bacterium]